MRTFTSIDELAAAVGETLGPGPWYPVEQRRVDLFADATDDHQWIHIDPVRAAAGPYGGTIAHGYLTLSLLPALVGGLYRVDGVRMGVNYGLNRVRFPAPVRVGGAVRAAATIGRVEPVEGGAQVLTTVTVDSDAGGKPVCVAETVSRLYVGPTSA
ncbi:Acyl dehydratase [Micromonospora phaseoli]|uniref:Acyl dehydratase n=1 Tax=Micromonospora phaseoli TaxID=1144548 RepID=A0A1H6UTC2_9ACTN|nr:MaoC family dehydratase [Micromonospora phaseoli]PZV99003.1 acyl dehydratase [Micromonospora phaseoli]GIJ76246.1 MaoC family dehydratase [Micromonospora phaseoli]SEI91305.1 Acyl dehydratase [Micromonospora phaseoli]